MARSTKAKPKAPKVKEVKELQQKAILESLSMGATDVAACAAAGISTKTLWVWQRESKAFDTACVDAQKSRIKAVKDVALMNALASERDPKYQTSLIAWLNNEGGWNNPQRHEVAGVDGAPLRVQVYLPDNGRDTSA